jgi:hypothetical protein
LPDGVFDEDYQPTPTVKEEVPTQVPNHLRSSPDFRFAAGDSDNEDEKPNPSQLYSPDLPAFERPDDLDVEMEHGKLDLQAPQPPTTKKKHVMFQLSRSNSEASASGSSSQGTTPTPVNSSAGSNRLDEVRTSQSTTDC